MAITIDQPTTTDPFTWLPSGKFDPISGASVLLDYTLQHPNSTPLSGRMGTQATISGDAWHYASQQTWLNDLQATGYGTGDKFSVVARLYDSTFHLVASSPFVNGGLVPQPLYPPATFMIPDIQAAVTVWLKRAPQIQALCQDRVSIVLKEEWQMPKYAIIVTGTGGSPPDLEIDRHYARLDIRFFGPGDTYNVRQRNATYLWRVAHPVLSPPVGLRISGSFHAAHCLVHSVRQDVAPIRMTEPGTDWPVVLVPYVASYMASPV